MRLYNDDPERRTLADVAFDYWRLLLTYPANWFGPRHVDQEMHNLDCVLIAAGHKDVWQVDEALVKAILTYLEDNYRPRREEEIRNSFARLLQFGEIGEPELRALVRPGRP